MNILEKVKKLFKKKEVIENNEEAKDKPSPEIEIKENKLDNAEILQILDSVKIDKNELALDRIESEAETISSYTKTLIKDLGTYQDFKEEKDKVEAAIRGISGKIKVVAIHCLELKNLLVSLEDHYYNPLIEAFKKVNEKAYKPEVDKLIQDLEIYSNLIKELGNDLTKVGGYDQLFNPEKNPHFRDEIEKEIAKRIVHGDLNDLLNKILTTISSKTLGIKVKIDKTYPLEEAKRLFR